MMPYLFLQLLDDFLHLVKNQRAFADFFHLVLQDRVKSVFLNNCLNREGLRNAHSGAQ